MLRYLRAVDVQLAPWGAGPGCGHQLSARKRGFGVQLLARSTDVCAVDAAKVPGVVREARRDIRLNLLCEKA